MGPDAKRHLFTSLVYYPTVVIHDPIATWFDAAREDPQKPPDLVAGDRKMVVQSSEVANLEGEGYIAARSDLERNRKELARVLPWLADLAPLIKNCVIVPVSQWRTVRQRQSAIFSALRHDLRDDDLRNVILNPIDLLPPTRDYLRGMMLKPNVGWKPGTERRAEVQDVAYFLNKTLCIADRSGAKYVPSAATDAALLDVKVKRLGVELKRHSLELKISAALQSVKLPFMEDLDARTLVSIRDNEESFDDWRRELRNAIRLIESSPTDLDAFVSEARDVLEDSLLPMAREVAQNVAMSTTLKKVTKERVAELTIGAGSLVAAAALVSQPIAAAATLGLGISAAARWVYGMMFRASPSGSKAVMAKLVKRG
ncbi:hypothetical protein ACFQ1S_01100 [Kibdelosporangium lantanae]|uniref:Uncharacterized protein n=1 Tax=Kibdelosporangium lantanae TaxID=1497396 RepID=A0ABW3M4J4_9PSEU